MKYTEHEKTLAWLLICADIDENIIPISFRVRILSKFYAIEYNLRQTILKAKRNFIGKLYRYPF